MFEMAREQQRIYMEMQLLSKKDQARVRFLATTTSLSWAGALVAVQHGARPRMPFDAGLRPALANLNLPPVKPARGKRTTRRERRNRP
ncbi:hypothetical protein GCM10008957_11160 [Deinococcus ruber]|uniref:Uncharacterized protein n=2 Tax=Deinococcus ruber TaxID=1848197 RepID=A0A918BZN0_9DEIO|nr:hypothetical protein GCM10008957_11160 [Deinococcus ruber]